MKKILIILVLLPAFSFSQVVEKAISDLIDAKIKSIPIPPPPAPVVNYKAISDSIDKKIKAFAYTLDSVMVKTMQSSSATTFSIDTLKVPVGKTILYQLSLNAKSPSTTDAGFAVKAVQVTNTGGVYSIDNSSDILLYKGKNTLSETKISWAIVLISGLPVVRITVATSPVNWELRRSTL